MKEQYITKYHNLEAFHWWFVSRRDIILRLIKNFPPNYKILDLGCSGGILLKEIIKRGFSDVIGIDLDKSAIDLAKKQGINAIIADATKTNFKDETFDLIIASDILEHLEDDNKALNEWNRTLKKSGKIIIFVPAFKFLWRKHDEENQHKRRYSKSDLLSRLKLSGLKVKRISYWNMSSLLPLIIMKLINSKSEDNLNKTKINAVLKNIIYLENFIATKFNIPIGVSLFVIAEKIRKI
ncbi:methyltransferase domain-containing protein [Candidatus Woesearchaeota archaeon]|nr:methyltransferase domain-containing protein [Candidatus Woesearchaeota archaeon]